MGGPASYQATVSSTKRKKDVGGGGDSGAEDGDGGASKRAKNTKKKPEVKKTTQSAGGERAHLASLGSWLPKKNSSAEGGGGEGGEGESVKKATLVLKFIEGHTNAVRRQVTLAELMGAW